MVMCARCHKRPAVVFMTKLENGKRVNEGICVTCAKDLGLPIDNLLGGFMSKMGLSAEQLSDMEQEFSEMMQSGELGEGDEEMEEGVVPTLDMRQLFQNGGEDAKDGLPAEKGKDATGEKAKNTKKNKKNKFLDAYCTNLTQRAREGKLDAIIGRERELARVTQILCRRQKNNPCLIGEPGVGKTAIVEALAERIAAGDVPYKLSDKEVYLLDLTALVSGTQFRGQFESRVQGLLKEIKEAGNIILVIDEVHNLVGTGGAEGSMNAANILKPALSRGEIRVIGATTLNEYRKHIEKDTALERRFQPVTVGEPSVADTVKMLEGKSEAKRS